MQAEEEVIDQHESCPVSEPDEAGSIQGAEEEDVECDGERWYPWHEWHTPDLWCAEFWDREVQPKCRDEPDWNADRVHDPPVLTQAPVCGDHD